MYEFLDGYGEDWRVRCGWMYYTGKSPEYRAEWLKVPPYISVKISAIFYDRRILGVLGLLGQDQTNNH